MASGTLSKEKVSCVARPYRAEGSCPRHEPVAMSVQDVLDRIASDFVPKVAAPPIVPAAYALPAQRLFELTAEVIDAVMEDSREAMLRDLREADLQHLPFDDLVPKFPARETSISIDNHEIGGNMTYAVRIVRNLRSPLGTGGLQDRDCTRRSRQKRNAGYASIDRSEDKGAPPSSTRECTISVRVRFRARRATESA